ncbi:MAG: hypothetical protein MR601_08490 [Erysipelotrichaceae bacterium]|nr:hypothetical protein [Erysipelotrichaceae bacterium]
MAKLSRLAKYEELRNKLQNDSESDIKSNDLSEYANKLNRIDSNSFKAMERSESGNHDPIHARREEYLNTTSIPKQKVPTSAHSNSFDNEYLDEYINEVKQYNKQQGLIVSEDTQRNILSEIYGDRKKVEKPYPSQINHTSEIPFKKSMTNPYSSLSDDDLEATRNTIALEVQSLINANNEYNLDNENTNSDLARQFEYQQTERKKLIEETDKMKLQLDEYEDNLSEFDDKVENTNRILNFVLIIMIFVLIVILGFVIYWVLLNKGIIQ